MTLPRFVVCGVPRCGTTSLYRYLDQHPEVAVSSLKEINFLSWPGPEVARAVMPWVRFPVTTREAYEELFADAGDRVAVDVSPSCFASPVAVERIRTFVPDAGLILVLRDPVRRAYSAYLNRLRKGYETRPPEEVLVAGDRSVDNGFYGARLARLFDAFGPDRARVWLFDDLTATTAATMAEVLDHLGVDAAFPLDLATVHNRSTAHRGPLLQKVLPRAGHGRRLARALPAPARRLAGRVWSLTQTNPPPLPAAVEARLRALYADDVRHTSELIGRDLGAWLPPPPHPGSG